MRDRRGLYLQPSSDDHIIDLGTTYLNDSERAMMALNTKACQSILSTTEAPEFVLKGIATSSSSSNGNGAQQQDEMFPFSLKMKTLIRKYRQGWKLGYYSRYSRLGINLKYVESLGLAGPFKFRDRYFIGIKDDATLKLLNLRHKPCSVSTLARYVHALMNGVRSPFPVWVLLCWIVHFSMFTILFKALYQIIQCSTLPYS
jgi:hypothetical protein